jgi:purine-binding chemotaxis protein CheW
MTAVPPPTALQGTEQTKHLTFTLGSESYGVPVLKVREIIRVCDITPVPQMPDYIKGVLNLRGKIIPVADLRLRFNIQRGENQERNCIIVVQVKRTDSQPSLMGLIVDAVEEVLNISANETEPPPDFGNAFNPDYIHSIAKIKGSVKLLLDIDKVVGSMTPHSA